MADNVPGVPVTPVSPDITPEPKGYLATEPVKAGTRGVQAVAFVSALLIFFGIDLSSSQEAVLPIITIGVIGAVEFLGNWIRANVTPVQRAQNRIDKAYVSDPTHAPKPTLPS